MTWTDIDLYKVRQLAAAADTALIKGNIEYLHKKNSNTYHHPGTGANFTVTGTLGQDIDANFNLSLTTTGGLVAACFYGQFKSSASPNSVRANIVRDDPISHIGRNLFYNYAVETVNRDTQGQSMGWIQFFPNLPAGTYTFKAIWGIPGGATGTLLVAYRPRMSVWEW